VTDLKRMHHHFDYITFLAAPREYIKKSKSALTQVMRGCFTRNLATIIDGKMMKGDTPAEKVHHNSIFEYYIVCLIHD
jgi:hypothetical protein